MRNYLNGQTEKIRKNIYIEITTPLTQNRMFLLGKIANKDKIAADEIMKLPPDDL